MNKLILLLSTLFIISCSKGTVDNYQEEFRNDYTVYARDEIDSTFIGGVQIQAFVIDQGELEFPNGFITDSIGRIKFYFTGERTDRIKVRALGNGDYHGSEYYETMPHFNNGVAFYLERK